MTPSSTTEGHAFHEVRNAIDKRPANRRSPIAGVGFTASPVGIALRVNLLKVPCCAIAQHDQATRTRPICAVVAARRVFRKVDRDKLW